jgi:hypothetical protein
MFKNLNEDNVIQMKWQLILIVNILFKFIGVYFE